MPDLARARQMLLIALQSSHDGERLNALSMALKTADGDAHALLGPQLAKADSHTAVLLGRIDQLNELNAELGRRLTKANARINDLEAMRLNWEMQHPKPAVELTWRRMATQLLGQAKVNERESDFLQSILAAGWSELTEKQDKWLRDIWRKYM